MMGLPPLKLTFVDIFKEVELGAQWLVGGGRLAKENLAKSSRIKRVSILFELKY
jgi:hypothetical protein